MSSFWRKVWRIEKREYKDCLKEIEIEELNKLLYSPQQKFTAMHPKVPDATLENWNHHGIHNTF